VRGLACSGRDRLSQLQADQPALRASRHFLDYLIRELDTHHILKKGLGLFFCTAQLDGGALLVLAGVLVAARVVEEDQRVLP